MVEAHEQVALGHAVGGRAGEAQAVAVGQAVAADEGVVVDRAAPAVHDQRGIAGPAAGVVEQVAVHLDAVGRAAQAHEQQPAPPHVVVAEDGAHVGVDAGVALGLGVRRGAAVHEHGVALDDGQPGALPAGVVQDDGVLFVVAGVLDEVVVDPRELIGRVDHVDEVGVAVRAVADACGAAVTHLEVVARAHVYAVVAYVFEVAGQHYHYWRSVGVEALVGEWTGVDAVVTDVPETAA